MIDDAGSISNVVVAEGLPLERLYARFDEIARGRVHGDSSAAHRSVIQRLESNQRRAEALGWTAFVLGRTGGSGRLELRGTPPNGIGHQLVPDAIPYDIPRRAETGESSDAGNSVGIGRAGLSWGSRMRWLDDGGR